MEAEQPHRFTASIIHPPAACYTYENVRGNLSGCHSRGFEGRQRPSSVFLDISQFRIQHLSKREKPLELFSLCPAAVLN